MAIFIAFTRQHYCGLKLKNYVCKTDEILLQDILVILKHSLQNNGNILQADHEQMTLWYDNPPSLSKGSCSLYFNLPPM